jgi:serine/threonine protein kinase
MEQTQRPAIALPGNFTDVRFYGSGAFGSVFKARDARTGDAVALKVLDTNTIKKCALETLREVAILRSCRHPSIVRMLDLHFTRDGDLTLVLDFVDLDLDTLMMGCPSDPAWSLTNARYILYQITSATSYLHSMGVVHRDIKPANIMVDFVCRVRLIDFGLSRFVNNEGGSDSDDELQLNCSRRSSLNEAPADANQPTHLSSDDHTSQDANPQVAERVSELNLNTRAVSPVNHQQSNPLPGRLPKKSHSFKVIPTNSVSPPRRSRGRSASACSPTCGLANGSLPAGGSTDDALSRRAPPMTGHVFSRWYRAPEVLLETGYAFAADMWGVGCVWAELLTTLRPGTASKGRKRHPLFPGSGSLLSARASDRRREKRAQRERGEVDQGAAEAAGAQSRARTAARGGGAEEEEDAQLMRIYDVIGSPSEREIRSFSDDRQVVARLRASAAAHAGGCVSSRRQGLDAAFRPSWCDPAAAGLLKGMVTFDPRRRITAQEVLQSTMMREEAAWWAQEHPDGPLPDREASRSRLRAARSQLDFGPRGVISGGDLSARLTAQVSAWQDRRDRHSQGQGAPPPSAEHPW